MPRVNRNNGSEEDHKNQEKPTSSRLPKHTRQEYQKKGRDAWDRAWQILHTTSGWKDAGGTDKETTGKVSYQNFADMGRVFKLEGIIALPPEKLFEEVVTKVEQNPKWNPTVLESTIIEKVDDNTDICHNITADAAGGLVASRDFVSVRHWRTQDGISLSAGCGVHHPSIPPSSKYVRGEQKPGGWAFTAAPNSQNCHFIWIVATDLKGWIPQKALDRVVPFILLDFMEKLRAFAETILQGQS